MHPVKVATHDSRILIEQEQGQEESAVVVIHPAQVPALISWL